MQNAGVEKIGGFITEIRVNEKSVYQRKTEEITVFSADTAYLTTDMLKTAVKSGTAKKLRDLPFDIAAKTGTTGTNKGNTDAYALSYTTNDLVAVWLGNADNTMIEYTGGGLPCNYLLRLNEFLYREQKPSPFSKPNTVQEVALDKTAYYDTHTMMLADDIAPVEYRINEWFKHDAIPTKKSDTFSFPSISTPTIKIENGYVRITFDSKAPKYYTYTIDRYDYATHTTVYDGNYIEVFYDNKLEKDKRYLYTVTPYFKDRKGKPIPLPEVTTKKQEQLLGEEWWKY